MRDRLGHVLLWADSKAQDCLLISFTKKPFLCVLQLVFSFFSTQHLYNTMLCSLFCTLKKAYKNPFGYFTSGKNRILQEHKGKGSSVQVSV